jgi:hypothetical protein
VWTIICTLVGTPQGKGQDCNPVSPAGILVMTSLFLLVGTVQVGSSSIHSSLLNHCVVHVAQGECAKSSHEAQHSTAQYSTAQHNTMDGSHFAQLVSTLIPATNTLGTRCLTKEGRLNQTRCLPRIKGHIFQFRVRRSQEPRYLIFSRRLPNASTPVRLYAIGVNGNIHACNRPARERESAHYEGLPWGTG